MENAPQSQIPKLRVEYEDGHTETVYGFSVLTCLEGARRLFYDDRHQPSVDTAALCMALCGDRVEVVPHAQY